MADERRLNELLKAFIQESPEYRNVTMPGVAEWPKGHAQIPDERKETWSSEP